MTVGENKTGDPDRAGPGRAVPDKAEDVSCSSAHGDFGRVSFLSLFFLALVQLYRWMISPLLGPHCRHVPCCSDYAVQALRLYGAWGGGWLVLARLQRCHPLGTHGFDPVPRLRRPAAFYTPWRAGRWSWKNTPGSDRGKAYQERKKQ